MLPNTYNSGCESGHVFICEKCDYACSQKWMWTRHLSTAKHQNTYNDTDNDLHKSAANCYKCKCGNEYLHRQSLYNHKKKCKGVEDIETYQALDKPTDADLIVQLIKQNQDFKDLIIEQNKTIVEAIKHNNITTNNNNTINSHNKTFNLHVFLNEDCKDAMNITDFVDSIKFQLADLEHMGKVGYVDGISNIILKNLKALDITKRPVHCTDQKRETIYIKDAGVWTKEDEDNKNVRKLIKKVAFRNSKCLSLFKEKYPDCITSESKYSDTYSKIVIEAMGGGSKCNDYDSENKIIRKIAKEMTIDKQRT
jgi:hypothetical protein